MNRLKYAIFALLFIFTGNIAVNAQTQIEIAKLNSGGNPASTRYRYLFENDRFTTPLQEIEFNGDGRGEFRFKRKGSDEIVNKLDVSPAVLTQVKSLFDELNFLAGNEEYQHKKDFSHLGKMTITQVRDGKERTVSFNYTDNPGMNRLTQIFRNLATQETRIFEIETIRSADPISTPAQLRFLESELKSKNIADPRRFVPILQDIKMDESVPLIARNHAERLLQMIKKEK